MTKEGDKVLSLEQALDSFSETSFIVICSHYEKEIKEQLLLKGIYNFCSINQIDIGGVGADYYDEDYFHLTHLFQNLRL